MTCLFETIPGCTSAFAYLYQYHFYGSIFLRFALGAVFLVHGYQKLFGGIEGTAQFFASVGIRPARPFAFIVGLCEFLGAIFLFAGLFVQPVAVILSIIMIVAIAKVKIHSGFVGGFELEFVLLMMALTLLLIGPGAYSLDIPL